jgi:hypothetical protein
VREATSVEIGVTICNSVGAVLIPTLKSLLVSFCMPVLAKYMTYQSSIPCSYHRLGGCNQIQRHRQS